MTPNTADFRIPPLFRLSRDRRYWGGRGGGATVYILNFLVFSDVPDTSETD